MRVLFLTHRLPYAPNRGDRARAFHIVRTLAPQVDLEVVSLAHDDHELRQVDTLRATGARVSAFHTRNLKRYLRAAISLPGTTPLTHCLLDAPGLGAALEEAAQERPPDVVLAYCSGMARFALEPPLDRYPLVLDFIDVDSEKWRALASTTQAPLRWIYARETRHLGRFEAVAARRASAALVVSERERDILLRLAPEANVHVIGLGVPTEQLRPPGAQTERPRVVFCGVMNYRPNADGVLWFAREVWPIVRRRHPNAEFVIVGSDPGRAIRRLATSASGIQVTGWVPEVRDYLWNASVSVAPLFTTRGTQNKVLEALAAGLPVVVTSQVLGGLPNMVRPGCVVADDTMNFAQEVSDLLMMSGSERRAIAARACLNDLSWDSQLKPLLPILRAAAAKAERG